MGRITTLSLILSSCITRLETLVGDLGPLLDIGLFHPLYILKFVFRFCCAVENTGDWSEWIRMAKTKEYFYFFVFLFWIGLFFLLHHPSS